MNTELRDKNMEGAQDIPPFIFELTDTQRDAVVEISRYLPSWEGGIVPDNDNFFTKVRLEGRRLPDAVAAPLIVFAKIGNPWGTLIVKNLPLDAQLPNTPSDGKPVHKPTSQSEHNTLLLMSLLGEPIAYADEKAGAIIPQISPVRGNETKQENTGSGTLLEGHTEDAFLPDVVMPHYVSLFCLRSDHEGVAETIALPIDFALPQLSQNDINLLSKPNFRIRFASSFGEQTRYSDAMAVLSGNPEHPFMKVDFHAMETTNEQAIEALGNLQEALLQNKLSHKLRPGELMIIDNRHAAHARTAFQARYDGEDRWLQRMFTVSDFKATQGFRPNGSHICLPNTA